MESRSEIVRANNCELEQNVEPEVYSYREIKKGKNGDVLEESGSLMANQEQMASQRKEEIIETHKQIEQSAGTSVRKHSNRSKGNYESQS